MKSFIDYIVMEEKIPPIPKHQLYTPYPDTKSIDGIVNKNSNIQILTTKESAKKLIMSWFDSLLNFPLSMNDGELDEYRNKPKQEWEKAWKDFYEETQGSIDDNIYMIVNGKSIEVNDCSFDDILYIIKNLNGIEFIHEEAGWGDVVFGGVIEPFDGIDDDEYVPYINTDFSSDLDLNKYEIKKIGKTEIIWKNKETGMKYFK